MHTGGHEAFLLLDMLHRNRHCLVNLHRRNVRDASPRGVTIARGLRVHRPQVSETGDSGLPAENAELSEKSREKVIVVKCVD
jgi:hypothetical protein